MQLGKPGEKRASQLLSHSPIPSPQAAGSRLIPTCPPSPMGAAATGVLQEFSNTSPKVSWEKVLRKNKSCRVWSPDPTPAPRAGSLPPAAPIALGESSPSPAPRERRSRRRRCSRERLIPGTALSYFQQYPAAGFARACFEFAVFNSAVGHCSPCSHPAAGCLCRRGRSPALGDTAALGLRLLPLGPPQQPGDGATSCSCSCPCTVNDPQPPFSSSSP